MFFRYRQNNSGGSFEISPKKGIGYKVIIEANNCDDANIRAEEIGLYFNGVLDNRDCDCCGDRWSANIGPGHEVWHGESLKGWGSSPSFVHYIDGRFESVNVIEHLIVRVEDIDSNI